MRTQRAGSLTQGLVGAWCPSLGATGFRLQDRSGRNNHGTLTNMVSTSWVTSGGKGALDFDNSDDFVNVGAGNLLLSDSGFSVTGWFNVRSTSSWRSFASKVNANNTNRQMFLGINGGFGPPTAGLSFFTNSAGSGSIGTSALTVNRWYFFSATHIGSSATANNLFVFSQDGGSEAMTRFSGNGGIDADSGVNPIRIGRFHDASPLTMDGQLDDIRVYNRALTAPEIRQLYVGGRGFGLIPERPRRRGTAAAAFKAYWARRQSQLIGGGL